MITGVSAATAQKFYDRWVPEGGVKTLMEEHHLQFAADFANFVMDRFIANIHKGAQVALRQAQQPQIEEAQ